MAENEDIEINAPKGNEWEVVSLTASAYAASPGPDLAGTSEGGHGELGRENEAASSNLMFMSGHFIFPPSQHENLPVEAKYNQEESGYSASMLVKEGLNARVVKDEKHLRIEDLVSRDFPEIPIFDEKGNIISVTSSNYGRERFFDEEQHSYNTTNFTSLDSEDYQITDASIEPLNHASENFKKLVEECECDDDANLPCEAWWKRRAFSIYTHAKEANTLWSIFVTAAAMGLVIIGHRWQQERWQILHLKWQAGINRERMGWFVSAISRFKDVIIGVPGPRSLVRGNASSL